MRYELKYAVDQLDESGVKASILTHPASFRTAYPERQVNNIYLDTPSLHCFYQNVEGQPRRNKMRLRWYGSSPLPSSSSTLEIKHKDRELGWKTSFPITEKISTKDDLLRTIRKVGQHQGDLTPMIQNTYKRSYFISYCGKFRITIDTHQTFQIPFTNMPALETTVYPIIVELKFDQKHFERSREITDFLPFRQTKNSKYTTGVTVLYF